MDFYKLRPNEIRNRYGSILIRNSRPQTEYNKERDFFKNTQVPELDKVSTCVTNKLSQKIRNEYTLKG